MRDPDYRPDLDARRSAKVGCRQPADPLYAPVNRGLRRRLRVPQLLRCPSRVSTGPGAAPSSPDSEPVLAMHQDQLELDVDLVRQLIAHQFAQWKALAVRQVSTAATVNAIFRIGDELAARLPVARPGPGAGRRRLEAEAAAGRAWN